MRKVLRKLIRKCGIDIVRYQDYSKQIDDEKRIFLQSRSIDCVIDVGANIGQFGLELRRLGYSGRIISFEPLSEAYSKLCLIAENDPAWDVINCALGEKNMEAAIHVSNNSLSSSLLQMTDRHTKVAPNSRYIREEPISIRTLDSEFSKVSSDDRNIFLKIDTQGYEHNVIAGAAAVMENVQILQVEMSICTLYSGSMLFDDLYEIIHNMGFRLHTLHPVMIDRRNRQLLQVDALFSR